MQFDENVSSDNFLEDAHNSDNNNDKMDKNTYTNINNNNILIDNVYKKIEEIIEVGEKQPKILNDIDLIIDQFNESEENRCFSETCDMSNKYIIREFSQEDFPEYMIASDLGVNINFNAVMSDSVISNINQNKNIYLNNDFQDNLFIKDCKLDIGQNINFAKLEIEKYSNQKPNNLITGFTNYPMGDRVFATGEYPEIRQHIFPGVRQKNILSLVLFFYNNLIHNITKLIKIY